MVILLLDGVYVHADTCMSPSSVFCSSNTARHCVASNQVHATPETSWKKQASCDALVGVNKRRNAWRSLRERDLAEFAGALVSDQSSVRHTHNNRAISTKTARPRQGATLIKTAPCFRSTLFALVCRGVGHLIPDPPIVVAPIPRRNKVAVDSVGTAQYQRLHGRRPW